jgi:hypothetical protein
LAERKLQLMLSPSLSTLFQIKSSKSRQKLLKLLVLPAINIWPNTSEKITSTWDAESTHGTCWESIRCCHVPVPIDFKQVWDEPSVNHMVNAPESKLAQSFTQSESEKLTSKRH